MSPTPQAITRARNGVFLSFAANGFFFASWMSRLPEVKQTLGLNPGQLGFMMLAISLGSIIGLPVAGRIITRLGGARTIHLAAIIFLPGLLLTIATVTLGHNHYVVMPGLFLFGLGTGLWDVTQNLEGAFVERAAGHSIMSWFHAAFSAGTVAGALIGAGVIALGVPLVPHLLGAALVGLIAAIVAPSMFLPHAPEPVHQPDSEGAAQPDAPVSAWLEPRTLLIGVMMLAASFAEGTANDWMSVAFVEGHHVDNALGVLALAVFLIFMTAGRVVGTGILDRYGRVVVLRTLFALAIIGSLMVIFGNVWIAYIGAAIWGVGASLGFPVGMSAAADDPQRAAARISVVSTIGYGAFLAGPPFLGFLGDHVGVLRALLFVTATAVIAAAVAPAARPLRRND